jgi:hypothetical protein
MTAGDRLGTASQVYALDDAAISLTCRSNRAVTGSASTGSASLFLFPTEYTLHYIPS